MSKMKSLSDYGELAEQKSYEGFKSIVTRLVQGLFLFKKRKGEVIAGASTFFTLLSFAPVLLIFISLLGVVISDNATARDYVMSLINETFPRVDKWLYTSLENVVDKRLHSNHFGFIELVFLIFTSMGISTSIVFGINTISKVDPDGGLLGDDVRSFFTGLGITFYIVLLVCLGQNGPLQEIVRALPYGDSFVFLFHNSIASSFFSLIFFSLFYKWCPSIKISYRDAFLGGATFVMSFLIGRSFYWIYLKYFKEDLIKDYGEFTNFMIALIWVYFLLCCFYYGASVAYSANVKLFSKPKAKRKS